MGVEGAEALGIFIGIFVAVWILDSTYEGGRCTGEDDYHEDENREEEV